MEVQYMKGPTFVEEKEGKREVLYGYGQHNIDSLVKAVKFALGICIIFATVLFLLMLYVFYLANKYHWASRFLG